jgi:hypothetical protein
MVVVLGGSIQHVTLIALYGGGYCCFQDTVVGGAGNNIRAENVRLCRGLDAETPVHVSFDRCRHRLLPIAAEFKIAVRAYGIQRKRGRIGVEYG